jgi:hydroxymethylbilane synthase
LVFVETAGDREPSVPLDRFGTQAVFTKELDLALLDGRVDLAVHSLKDLPNVLTPGVAIAAVGRREDPRDALISRAGACLHELPKAGIVATCSPRRRAQLLRVRPDLQIVPLRGNIATRLRKLDETESWSAIVLAVAGLVRLELGARITERLDPETMLPAPGQGAIAVTGREDAAAQRLEVAEAFTDPVTERCVAAERALLDRVEGGCLLPVGALATALDGELVLRARILSADGSGSVDETAWVTASTVPLARDLGYRLAESMLGAGGADLIDRGHSTGTLISGPG